MHDWAAGAAKLANWPSQLTKDCQPSDCTEEHYVSLPGMEHMSVELRKNIQRFKHDVSCIVRSEARRGHEDQSMHEARSAESIDVSEWPLSASDLTMHDTSCLNPIITWLFGFDKLWSRNSQAKFWSRRWRIIHCGKSMHGFVGHVHSDAFMTS